MRSLFEYALLGLTSAAVASLGAGCSLNEAGLQAAADASTSDVVKRPDSGPSTWCSTSGAGHDFCADFDASLRGTELGAWCSDVPAGANCGVTENGGTLTRDLTVSTSPPASANAKTMLGGAASQASLTRDFPGVVHALALGFDLQIDAAGTARTVIARVTLEDPGGDPHRVDLVAIPPGGDAGADGRLVVVERPLFGAMQHETALPFTLPLNKFARVELRVGIAPNTVTVVVDGVASSATSIDAPGTAMGRALQIGIDSTPADTWQLHVDDLTFDFTK